MIATQAVHESASKARAFLERYFRENEKWADFTSPKFGSSTAWVSAYTGYCLSHGEGNPGLLRDVCTYLLSQQGRDGAWGWGPEVCSDCDTSSFCSMLFASQRVLSEEQTTQLADFLRSHQLPHGGFATFHDRQALKAHPMWANLPVSFNGWCIAHNSVTAAALQALVHLGTAPDAPEVVRGLEFLKAAQGSDGLWSCYWWTETYYPTYQAVRAAQVAASPSAPKFDLERVVDALAKRQNPAGHWSSADPAIPCPFSTALALRTLHLLGQNQEGKLAEVIRRGVQWLHESQSPDGSWTSAYAIMRIPHYDEENPTNTNSKLRPDVNHIFTTANVEALLSSVLRSRA